VQPVPSRKQLESIRNSVQTVGKLSDSLVRVGPFSLGVDGVLAWIPGVGEVYSAGAGLFLIVQGARAEVPVPTLAACAAMMLVRTGVDAVPLAGALAADLFTAHKWSSGLIARAIDKKLAASGPDPLQPQSRRRRWRDLAGRAGAGAA
jgi:hypothetical protein